MSRWWDPGSEVALLGDVDDPKVGLANAVAALHRAGAAAINDAATTHPVVDDLVLVQALANARSHFAPLLIEPVAKATTGDPGYAGLLLRDIFDDAELAALSLFRTAVAKGVPRRAAADRVAKVYGTPQAGLGRYARLATDMRTSPMLLTDVADETLFTAITRLVDDEARVSISKAEAPEARRAAQAKEPRDEGGRYAVEGQKVEDWLAGQMTGEHLVDEERGRKVAPPGTSPEEPRKFRRYRKLRRLEVKPRALREQVSREQTLRTRSGRALSARAIALRELAAKSNSKQADSVPDVSTLFNPRNAPTAEDHVKEYDKPPNLVELEDDLTVAMPFNQATAFLREAKKIYKEPSPGQRMDVYKITRAGALQDYAGNPERDHPFDASQSSPNKQRVAGIAAAMRKQPTYDGVPDPVTKKLSEEDLAEMSSGSNDARREALVRIKKDFLRTWAADNDGAKVNVDREVGYVDYYPAQDNDDDFYLVWWRPREFGDDFNRPAINIAEVHLPASGITGTIEIGTKDDPNANYTVNPDQVLRVVLPTDRFGHQEPYEVFWDNELRVLRTHITTEAGDESDVEQAKKFGKAMSREQFQEAVASGEIRRDADTGEFENMEDYLRSLGFAIADEQAPAPPRVFRGKRKLRRLESGPRAERDLRNQDLREQAGAERAMRAHTARLHEAIRRSGPRGEGEINNYDDYTQLTDAEMIRRLGVPHDPLTHQIVERDAKRGLLLHSEPRSWLINRGVEKGADKVESSLLQSSQEDYWRLRAVGRPKMLEPMKIRDTEDWDALYERLVDLSFDHGVEAITARMTRSIEDQGPVVSVRFELAHSMPKKNLLRWDSGNPEDRSLRLTLESETRGLSRATLRSLVDMWKIYDAEAGGQWVQGQEDWILNPTVRIWRVERGED